MKEVPTFTDEQLQKMESDLAYTMNHTRNEDVLTIPEQLGLVREVIASRTEATKPAISRRRKAKPTQSYFTESDE